jgi:hypothetical protein
MNPRHRIEFPRRKQCGKSKSRKSAEECSGFSIAWIAILRSPSTGRFIFQIRAVKSMVGSFVLYESDIDLQRLTSGTSSFA